MPVNLEKLNTKLGAIAAKDLPAIVAEQVTIPFLNKPYTLAQLQAWMNKRVNQLNSAKTYTDQQALTARTNLYNGLNTAGKAVADKIIARESYTLPANLTAANYDRLVGIILITWVLE